MVKYIASGEFVPGIPARDLTEEEWKDLDPKVRKQLVDHGLYQEQGKPKKGEEVSDG